MPSNIRPVKLKLERGSNRKLPWLSAKITKAFPDFCNSPVMRHCVDNGKVT